MFRMIWIVTIEGAPRRAFRTEKAAKAFQAELQDGSIIRICECEFDDAND